MEERDIFLEALEIPTPEAQAACLHGACGRDVALRDRVEALLRGHFSADSLIAGPALAGAPLPCPGRPRTKPLPG